MIEAVQDRINRNASELLTPQEIDDMKEPRFVHTYIDESPDGVVTAARVQHRIGEDGSGGGFKVVEADFTSDISLEKRLDENEQHALGLATLMSLKAGLVDLDLPDGFGNDFGGAKGEMYVPHGTLASPEKKAAILRRYVERQYAAGAIDLGVDRHAPDMNTGPYDMDVMAERLVELRGDDRSRAAFSGKSFEQGGLEGREIATGQGMVYILEKHLATLDRNPAGMTVAIQGSGNVGYHFAKLASEQLGVKIVGMSDHKRAIVGDSNHPLELDDSVKFENRAIAWWDEEKHRKLTRPDDLLAAEVDIFVFAATPDVVTVENGNVDVLNAEIIVEGANNPMDSVATDHYLRDKKKRRHILPGILANAGGFVTSNFEYNQNMTRLQWKKALAMQVLKQVMYTAHDNVYATANERGEEYNLVDAAYTQAVKQQWEKDNGLYVPARTRVQTR